MAQEVWDNRQYQFAHGNIIFRRTKVGTIHLGSALVKSSEAESPYNLTESNPSASSGQNTEVLQEYKSIAGGKKLLSVNLLLSIVQAMASSASVPFDERIAGYDYEGDRLGISITLRPLPNRPRIYREDLSIALVHTAADVVASREYVEKQVTFYYRGPPRLNLAIMSIRKMTASAMKFVS